MKKGFEPLLRVPNRMCFNPCAAITLPHSFEDIYSNIYSFRRKNIYSHLLVDDLSRLSSGSRVFGQAHAIVIFNFQSAFNQNLKLLFQSELSIRLQWKKWESNPHARVTYSPVIFLYVRSFSRIRGPSGDRTQL